MGIVFLSLTFYIGTGLFDIAADKKHWRVTEWFLAFVRDGSIESQLSKITIPSNIDDPVVFVEAAGNYNEMCSKCHLAPNVKKSELRVGLYPRPPDFTQYVLTDPARSFWVIKHGVKMTAMPSWGFSHTDEEIWKLVTFIHKLPELNSKSYTELVAEYGGSHQYSSEHAYSNADGHKLHSDSDSHGLLMLSRYVTPWQPEFCI